METRSVCIVLLLAAVFGPGHVTAANEPMTPEEQERWLDDFDEEIPAAPQVGKGELLFFTTPPAPDIHHLHNRLTIDSDSLITGFVQLHQCHRQLDAVPDAEISYRYRQIRGLTIASHRNIEAVWVEGQSVQMKNVGRDAELCVKAEVRVLYSDGEGRYLLRNGPFHRRFLDGYFPMRVSLDIRYPAALLRVAGTDPASQPGFRVRESEGEIGIEAWFAGMLNVAVEFIMIDAEGGFEARKP